MSGDQQFKALSTKEMRGAARVAEMQKSTREAHLSTKHFEVIGVR